MNETRHGTSKRGLSVQGFGGQAAIVAAGTAFTFLLGFPFQIYLARSLGVSGLGVIGATEAVVLVFTGTMSLGLAPMAMRFIPEYKAKGDTHSIRVLILSGITILSVVGVCAALLIGALSQQITKTINIDNNYAELFVLMGWLAPLTLISFFVAQCLRGFEEIRAVILSTSVVQLSAKVILTLVFFNAYGASPGAYADAILFSLGIAILPMLAVLWRLQHKLPRNKHSGQIEVRRWLSFAMSNHATGVLNSLIGSLDRIIVSYFLGASAVGVLMVVKQLQQFPSVFHQIVLTVVSPIFSRLKTEGDMMALANLLHLSNDWIMRIAIPMMLFLVILAKPVLSIYGPEFSDAGYFLLILLITAVAVNLGTGPAGTLLNMTGHHLVLMKIVTLTSIATILGYFALIPSIGIAGVGVSILITTTVSMIIIIRFVNFRLGIGWFDKRFKRWLLPSVLTAIFIILFSFLFPKNSENSIGAVGLILSIFGSYLVYWATDFIIGIHEDDAEVWRGLKSGMAGAFLKGRTKS